jgi:hypothetical protein
MTEETKEKRSLTHAAIMLGTYLICVSIPVNYYLVKYHACNNDSDFLILMALLTFPMIFLEQFVLYIMGMFALVAMDSHGGNPFGHLFLILFVCLCYGPYILLFWRALKVKNNGLMYLFIAWSIANAVGFLYTEGYFKTRRMEEPRNSTEVRDLRR